VEAGLPSVRRSRAHLERNVAVVYRSEELVSAGGLPFWARDVEGREGKRVDITASQHFVDVLFYTYLEVRRYETCFRCQLSDKSFLRTSSTITLTFVIVWYQSCRVHAVGRPIRSYPFGIDTSSNADCPDVY
jgi:hypothetical protein